VLRRVSLVLAVLATSLGLTACGGPSVTGYVGLAMDPANRLLAVLAVCEGQHIGWLTLADENTGTRTTVAPPENTAFGGTVLLSGPVVDPHPEGLLDLLDRNHNYTLDGGTAKPDTNESTGVIQGVRFKLSVVLGQPKLKQGSVLVPTKDGATLMSREEFISTARKNC
jgi:hypothetical protein